MKLLKKDFGEERYGVMVFLSYGEERNEERR